jgi:hypothetical protein
MRRIALRNEVIGSIGPEHGVAEAHVSVLRWFHQLAEHPLRLLQKGAGHQMMLGRLIYSTVVISSVPNSKSPHPIRQQDR